MAESGIIRQEGTRLVNGVDMRGLQRLQEQLERKEEGKETQLSLCAHVSIERGEKEREAGREEGKEREEISPFRLRLRFHDFHKGGVHGKEHEKEKEGFNLHADLPSLLLGTSSSSSLLLPLSLSSLPSSSAR